MDTTDFGFHQWHLENYLLPRFVRRGSFLKDSNQFGYYNCKVFKINGHKVRLSWGRRKPQYAHVLVTFHLSRHTSLKRFLKYAKKTLGKAYPLLFTTEIVRMDFCLNLKVDYTLLRSSLYHPRATSIERIKKGRKGAETMYIGKAPLQSYIYNKKTIRNKFIDFAPSKKLLKSEDGEAITQAVRLEVRRKRKKKLIHNFTEIYKLKSLNPFEHLKVLEVNNQIITPDLPDSTLKNIYAFLHLRDRDGYQDARIEFNKDGNFQKTIGRFIGSSNVINLEEIWKKKIDKWLGKKIKFPQFDGNLDFIPLTMKRMFLFEPENDGDDNEI